MSGGGAWTAAAVAAVTGGYGLFSRRLASTPLSAPMLFTGLGVLIGPAGLDVIHPERDAGAVRTLVEAALTLVLFADAMTVRRRDLRTGGFLPLRLLALGLPLTIGAGWLLAWPLLPGLTGGELALLAAILAPTDAALGKAAMTSPAVPPLVREGLNVESGLNDGLVLPFFVLFLAAIPGTATSAEGADGVLWRTLLLSTAVGLAVGLTGGRLLPWSQARGWVTGEWRQVFVLAVAVGAYTVATAADGSGFIAAWTAGFAFALGLRQAPPLPADGSGGRAADLTEYLGGLLATLSFLVFGAVLLGPALEELDWRVVTYAVLSLTVVRTVPVVLALAGTGFRWPTVAYIGWFGPRGLASVVFGLLVVEEHVPGIHRLGLVVAATVGLSVVAHGMSAPFLAARYGTWFRAERARTPELREALAAPEAAGTAHPARRRLS
ncbi:cation:proton antiporter [Kitasatospora sp. NPDC051705]|uniref:cation:proton antiporter n=1 Tax=Kitasatospora sp. NPDC051705 TaxID=3364057 RepID=UPI00379A9077